MSFLSEYNAIPADDPTLKVASQVKLVAQWLRTNPRKMFEELREKQPIFVSPKITLVTRWADVIHVLSRHELFSVRGYKGKMDPSVGPFMLGRDETPINWDEKALMKSLLRADDSARVRTMVANVAAESLAASGPLELVSRVGRQVPLEIVKQYFGFQGPDDATMLKWSKATQWDMFRNPTSEPAIHEANVRAGKEMRCYLEGFLGDRLKEAVKMDETACAHKYPGERPNVVPMPCFPDDVVSRLIRIVQSGQTQLGFERVISNVCGLLVGAIETMSQAIVQATEQILLLRPDLLAKAVVAAKVGETAFDSIVWEALRFNPIAPLQARFCERDTVLAGVKIVQGTVVAACTASAMFDEEAFPAPDEVQWNRPVDSYLHFGFGHHECLGKLVGMVAIPEAVRQILLVPGIAWQSQIDFKGGPFPESFVVGRASGTRTQGRRSDPNS